MLLGQGQTIKCRCPFNAIRTSIFCISEHSSVDNLHSIEVVLRCIGLKVEDGWRGQRPNPRNTVEKVC